MKVKSLESRVESQKRDCGLRSRRRHSWLSTLDSLTLDFDLAAA